LIDNGYLLCFRWLDLLAEPQKVSGQIRLAAPSNRHQPRQIWPRSWPDKLNSSTNLCKLKWANIITNPEAERNPHRPVIKTSSAPSLHCFIRRMSPLTLTLGFAPSNPSSPYCLPHVQMRTRRSLQPNNSVALPASGGIIIMTCSLPVMSSLGMSFGPLFERTTSPKDSLSESSMNF
jgi:hypothetical protein